MSTFAIVLTSAPHQNKTATAISFAEAILTQGHNLIGIFLYQDGVLHASSQLNMPTDELQAINKLKSFNRDYNTPLHLCITAAEKRGLTDTNNTNIDASFTVSGLGELVELANKVEHMVQL